MPRNSKGTTPKIKDVIGPEKVQGAVKDLTSYVAGKFDFANDEAVIIGIQTRGALLAKRVADSISDQKGTKVQVGVLDITLYRDDFSTASVSPIVGETRLDFEIDGKKIVLIDDVLFTGRTIRAAIDEIMDYGRPQSITLAVLVDRGHRELPIQPDFAAMNLATKKNETVNLHLKENDEKEEIVICEVVPG
jgi:pyrimidine operon attenuation protein / uracil phosphoribosyltransferase